MRQAEQDGEHIWLRQSVTFTVAGQTRTVEIAIPLRPGSTAEDVETLLGEADAGMERLSRRLDDRVAALLRDATPAAPATEPPVASAAAAEVASVPLAQSPLSTPPAGSAATTDVPETAPPSERPTPAPVASPAAARPHAQPAPTTASRPAQPPARPAPAPGRAAPSGPLAGGPASTGPDLTRPEFIAAAQELGMNVKQAMERLGVRSLEGLNLREALEALRRQAVRGETPPVSTPPTRGAAAQPSTAPAREPAPATPEPRYFDEEDDLDVTFTVDGDEGIEEEFGMYAAGESGGSDTPDPLDEIEELDLDDVPDFGPPPSASRSSSSAARRSNAPSHPLPTPAASPAMPNVAATSDDRARALQLVGQMRAARGGGVASSQQRTAYRNIVARELGEPEAAALVRGLWRTTPDRLSAEQLDTLISWGKQDTFSDEAVIVLAELRAERARAAAEQPSPAGEAPRPAPRGRSAGTGRGAPGAG